MQDAYVIGVDYGTDSVRAVVVNAGSGEETAASVFYYPRWKAGKYCDPAQSRFRQHPLDYREGLEFSIRSCLEKAGPAIAARVKGISIDTTGSTPVAVDASGTPLALLPQFADNPNAMFVLWKDHTAVREAAELNAHAQHYPENYLRFAGGIYSSEWFWAKLLHILRADSDVSAALCSWVEHCDWIPFLLTGGTDVRQMKRSVCAAGHKALWAEAFNGLPPDDFFAAWDAKLAGITRKLFRETYPADQPAGTISPEWAATLGLPGTVVIGVGAFDAHMGAVGGQIEPYHLSKVMGTSTCDMLVAPMSDMDGKLIKGICGQVPGSVIPGMMGMEAGQSAFGDAYAWFRGILLWPLEQMMPGMPGADPALLESISDNIITALSKSAAALPLSPDNELAVDWLNGRRTPDADQSLKGAFTGLHLGTDAPRMFRALVEATCFGAKKIVDRFTGEGIPVKGLIGLGGVAKKSPFIMQMMADVVGMPIRIHRSEQTCALGAAMFAATAAGLYTAVEQAMAAMGPGFSDTYFPNPEDTALYAERYKKYSRLGAFIEQSPYNGNGKV